MREILFKAKRLSDGEWVEGNLFVNKTTGQHMIIAPNKEIDLFDYMTVTPSTVCQYTGLTDRNGKKVFEGDVIHAEWIGKKTAPVTFESGMFKAHGLSLITWLNSDYEGEVIGNIHDGEGGQ